MLRVLTAAFFLMFSMSQLAKADQLEFCDPIYSGTDSAYVPCISSVDLGDGSSVVYDNDGNIVHTDAK